MNRREALQTMSGMLAVPFVGLSLSPKRPPLARYERSLVEVAHGGGRSVEIHRKLVNGDEFMGAWKPIPGLSTQQRTGLAWLAYEEAALQHASTRIWGEVKIYDFNFGDVGCCCQFYEATERTQMKPVQWQFIAPDYFEWQGKVFTFDKYAEHFPAERFGSYQQRRFRLVSGDHTRDYRLCWIPGDERNWMPKERIVMRSAARFLNGCLGRFSPWTAGSLPGETYDFHVALLREPSSFGA